MSLLLELLPRLAEILSRFQSLKDKQGEICAQCKYWDKRVSATDYSPTQ